MSTRRFRSILTGVAALSLWAVTLPSDAVTLTFTDSAAFFAGLPGQPQRWTLTISPSELFFPVARKRELQ